MSFIDRLFGLRPDPDEDARTRGETIAAGAIFAGVLLAALVLPALLDKLLTMLGL